MNEDEEEIIYVSKSELKRDCHALTDLGVDLAALPENQLKTIPMSDSLLNAVMEAQNIHKHSAIKRQRLYIGKLIRKEDWETIQQRVEKFKEPLQQQNAVFKSMENWRDRMLAEGDKAVNDFIGEHHHADRQKLRQMVKNASKEKQMEKPPAHARKLFKYIREIVENNSEDL